jgi:tryptophanase
MVNKDAISGLKITWAPELLRHFMAKLEWVKPN